MKNLVLVLVDVDKTIELVGVFSTTRDAVQYIWDERVGKPFTAYPIGHDGVEDETQPVMRANLAMVQLRDAPAPAFAGLGLMDYHGVWVRQQNVEGNLGMVIACFSAADRTEKPFGELRWAKLEGVVTYTHVDSAFGQSIEALRTERLARNVQDKMLTGRESMLEDYADADAKITKAFYAKIGSGTAIIGTTIPEEKYRLAQAQVKVDDFICDACAVAAVPGALFPFAPSGMDDHAYVQACDVCNIFQDDMRAAKSIGVVFGKLVKLSEDERPYIDGLDYTEAMALAKSTRRPLIAS